VGELSPDAVVTAIRRWLERCAPEAAAQLRPGPAAPEAAATGVALTRLPSFCSGCPHNTSTVVPEGSVALGGIGCHGMAVWLPDRRTLAVTQMGGEGANWIGQAPFTDTPHIFQNMGDGTYFHSGLLAIRAAVTAGVNITYKLLVNGAVAMTGGQPIEGEPLDGEITTPEIAHQLAAEGVQRIAVVSNEPDKYGRGVFPRGVTVHDRDELDRVQRDLRDVKGVTALIYDQTCAAEARRLRKRGEFPDPDERIFINELVCEGCGDCSVQSNCISIEPVETEFGRKRVINQSSCNKDYSCLRGYCPSFVSVIGGVPRRASTGADGGDDTPFRSLPDAPVADASRPVNILVTGIGGSGVVTVGALLGMAAHLEGKGCSTLDVTGLAQKNGPVTSHVRIAKSPEDLFATRIAAGGADLVLGCDVVVTSGIESLKAMSSTRTTAVINDHVAPTSDFASDPDLDLSSAGLLDAIRMRAKTAHVVGATRLATALLGDSIAGNLFLLGYALQLGQVPVGLPALERAIELNGRAVEMNKRALAWGRLAAHDPAAIEAVAAPALRRTTEQFAQTLDDIVALRVEFLTAYQSRSYARRYTDLVERVREAESKLGDGRTQLGEAVARYFFKLLAYKDEYEVARLHSSAAFREVLERAFEGDYKLRVHLRPQLLFPRDPDTGFVKEVSAGSWVFSVFRLLSKLRFLRGTPLDPFGHTAHRRLERQLIGDYEATLAELIDGLTADNQELAVQIASLPEMIRGYDHVKERHLEGAREKATELLAAFRLRASGN
jgi:indolepyruvate ferredoxin oxidoreductase